MTLEEIGQLFLQHWLKAAAGGVLTLAGLIYKRVKDVRKKRAEEKREKAREEEQARIAQIAMMEAQLETLREGMRAVLRDRIIQAYNHYLREGACPIYARDNIKAMYRAYKALGGNGTVSELMDKLEDMPTE